MHKNVKDQDKMSREKSKMLNHSISEIGVVCVQIKHEKTNRNDERIRQEQEGGTPDQAGKLKA